MNEKFIAILEEENKNEALNIINEKDELGNTLLMYAVLYNSADFIEFLIQNGADINTINNEGDNALLRVLCERPRIDVAKILINNGIDINYSFNSDMTPLMLACMLGGQPNKVKSILDNLSIENNHSQDEYLELVNLLIEKGADINAMESKDGITPLLSCIFFSNIKALKLLLEKNVDLNIKRGDFYILDLLILFYLGLSKFYKTHNIEDFTDLKDEESIDSIKDFIDLKDEELIDIIEIFFEKGAQFSISTIYWGLFENSFDAINNNKDYTIYQKETKSSFYKIFNKEKYDKIIKLVFKYNKNLETSNGLYTIACMTNNLEIINLLLEKGNFDINFRDEEFGVPVAEWANSDIRKFLFKKGLKVETYNFNKDVKEKEKYEAKIAKIIDELNLSEVSKVLLSRDIEELKILISENRDFSYINIIDLIIKETILNTENPYSYEFIELILKNGANINWQNEDGNTALIFCCVHKSEEFVNLLLTYGADKNIKNNKGHDAFDIAYFKGCKEIIDILINHVEIKNNPKKLVKLLTNFTIDKPIKYTTHTWDFGELKKEYISFEGYMNAVKTQFDSMKHELETLSPNLYKKIYTFLLETTLDENYSWCSKVDINIGWSSLNGLKEWCDSGKNPFDFKLQKPFSIPPRTQISTFGEVINLFKQEIEIRADFKNLETIFNLQKNRFDSDFKLDLQSSKLSRQFYTDTQKFIFALNKIFDEIRKRKEYQNIEVATLELDDRSIEIKIIQIDSQSSRSANELLERSKQSGDLFDIVENLKNLCDYSCESSYENKHFRVNFLHSNNVKDIEILEDKPRGFTHILRFYK
jgi:ankyrin repeat protein